MKEKISELVNSLRFWILTAGALFQVLKIYLPGQTELFDVLSFWLGGTFLAGTADSVATKLSSKKAEVPK